MPATEVLVVPYIGMVSVANVMKLQTCGWTFYGAGVGVVLTRMRALSQEVSIVNALYAIQKVEEHIFKAKISSRQIIIFIPTTDILNSNTGKMNLVPLKKTASVCTKLRIPTRSDIMPDSFHRNDSTCKLIIVLIRYQTFDALVNLQNTKTKRQ